MPLGVTANFGTKITGRKLIMLDEYGDRLRKSNLSIEDEKEALDLLEYVLTEGKWFANDGHRNNFAVDSCIALHVLGYDPEEWFANLFAEPDIKYMFYQADIDEFMEHVERVAPYLGTWGPPGKEYRALDFKID